MRLKTLNGAPLCERLDFSEESLLDISEHQDFSQSSFGDTLTWLSWRSVLPKGARLPSGWTQPDMASYASVPIPTGHEERFPTMIQDDTTQLDTSLNLERSGKDDFIEYSMNFHDTLLSSQVMGNEDRTVSSDSFLTASFGDSFTADSFSIDKHETMIVLNVPAQTTVTSIASLPNARTLRSIYPQTPTPNLICVLMANPERREVVVRKTGRKIMLCEIVVADDTHAGFKITFWLHPPRDSNNEQVDAQNKLDRTLESMKVGDILLLRHIALTSFREVVFGQSLNAGIARARTTIDVLMSSNGAPLFSPSGLPPKLADVFTRVKKWAKLHVAGYDTGLRKRKATSAAERNSEDWNATRMPADDSLPPDTMEAV